MAEVGVDKNVLMRADSAEPDRIQEISDAGYLIQGAKKGKGWVRDGIDNVKRCHLHITKRSVNTIKEIKFYKWRVDPKTDEILDEPVKYKDDAMAAKRYAIGDIIFDADLFDAIKDKNVEKTEGERFWDRVKVDVKKSRGDTGIQEIDEEEYEDMEAGYVSMG